MSCVFDHFMECLSKFSLLNFNGDVLIVSKKTLGRDLKAVGFVGNLYFVSRESETNV